MEFTQEELANEVWRWCVGYEDSYQISNLGRVKSVTRTFTNSRGSLIKLYGQTLKTALDKDGYQYVTLKGKKKKVHRLVAEAFIANPDNKETVNHFDENKTNNRVSNLGWFSFAEQSKYSKGINITLFIDGKLVTYPSVNEAAEELGLDNYTVKRLSKEYSSVIDIVHRLLYTSDFSIKGKKREKSISSSNTSGYTGITYKGKKWCSRVSNNGVRYLVGYFDSAEDAVLARDNFIIEHNIPLPLQTTKKEIVDKNTIIKSWEIIKGMIETKNNSILTAIIDTHDNKLREYLK